MRARPAASLVVHRRIGGVGRDTDIDYVEVMNNIDDGIEIWGGAVNLKYINIWNVGDDSFDVDEGWRGKAQFAFALQGIPAYGAIWDS